MKYYYFIQIVGIKVRPMHKDWSDIERIQRAIYVYENQAGNYSFDCNWELIEN